MNVAEEGLNNDTICLRSLDQLSSKLQGTLPLRSDSVSVVITIPARNEGERLSQLFDVLLSQAEAFLVLHKIEVLVLANGCIDNTTAVCEKFKSKHPLFPLYWFDLDANQIQNVGAARRVVMNVAYERLAHANGVIAMTDADTLPEKGWLKSLLNFVVSDIDLLCGRIEVDYDNLPDQTVALLEAKKSYSYYASQLKSLLYPEFDDPWPRHGYNSGPNMAIKKEAYKSVGGMPPQSSLEDIALYDLVKSAGFRVKHCMDSIVVTSSRLKARVAHGFANELRLWSSVNMNTYSYKVEDLLKLTARFKGCEMIKSYYASGNFKFLPKIAAQLCLQIDEVQNLLQTHSNHQSCERAVEYLLEKNEVWNIKFPKKDIFSVNLEFQEFFSDVNKVVSAENEISRADENSLIAKA
ncbi:MAG: glycosyltransferase family 2 protein [Leeuwenhoekiella sp.]